MKHSKLPWEVVDIPADTTLILANSGIDQVLCDDNIDLKDAAFIVEACNNYEALQERCKKLEEALRHCLNTLDLPFVSEHFAPFRELLNPNDGNKE